MKITTFEKCQNSERKVTAATWESVRLILKDDNMGFSFHITTIFEQTQTHIHYKNHLESVYCISGEGEIEIIGDKIYPIKPGTLYLLDKHDEHFLRAFKGKEMVMACVFTPPLIGCEVHDDNGVYPLVD